MSKPQEKRRSSLENLQFFHESWIDVTEFLIYLIKDKNFKIFNNFKWIKILEKIESLAENFSTFLLILKS